MYATNGTAQSSADLTMLAAIANGQLEDAADIVQYREFYDGDQGTLVTDRLATFLSVETGQKFATNFCQIIVDSLAERLEVTGFSTGDDDTDAVLWNWWQRARMDAKQRLTHTYAGRDGYSYIVTDWNNDEQRPGFHVHEAWDGDSGIKAHWSGKPGQSTLLFATKRWREEFDADGKLKVRMRMTMYFPDRVEKYITGTGPYAEAGWQPYADEDAGTWPLPWVGRDGKPLGVAVFPFLNRGEGVSELKQVLPVQVALNKTVIDMLASADTTGFPIYTKTGGQSLSGADVFPGALWQDTNPEAKFGQLPAADLTPLIAVFDKFVHTLAIITRRPLALFTGDNVSGESLKQRESGLVAQAEAATVIFGNAWEDCMYLAVKLNELYGTADIAPDVVISTKWGDVETRNEEAHRQAVREDFRAGIIDQEQAWDELGLSEEAQTAMLERQAIARTQRTVDAINILNATQPQQPQEATANAAGQPIANAG